MSAAGHDAATRSCPGCGKVNGSCLKPSCPMVVRGRVTSMREWLIGKRDFDRLRQLRPWGIGNVVQHSVAVGESRERPGQLRIERGWPDADA